MTELEAIEKRHAVRNYQDKAIPAEITEDLSKDIEKYNNEGNLHIQIIENDKNAFKSLIPAFGRFKEVNNYIALVGQTDDNLPEKCGYYGEKLVLKAQQLGLNTCWVSTSYNRSKCNVEINNDEELICVIAFGYGVTQGTVHKSKEMKDLCELSDEQWFINGMKAAMLAPTGMNKQNFVMKNSDGIVSAAITKDNDLARIGLGIVKYHFEVGAGKEHFIWR